MPAAATNPLSPESTLPLPPAALPRSAPPVLFKQQVAPAVMNLASTRNFESPAKRNIVLKRNLAPPDVCFP